MAMVKDLNIAGSPNEKFRPSGLAGERGPKIEEV